MTDALVEAKNVIKQRLRELDEERDQLQSALRHLDDNARASRGTRGSQRRGSVASTSSRGSARQGKSRRRVAARGKRRQQLVDFLKQNPGSSPSSIAKALGVSPSNAQNVLRSALADGAVEKEGSRYSLAAGAKAA